MADTSTYQHPLQGRYASEEMKRLFSDDVKFGTWRRLWLMLAQIQKDLGLLITDAQLNEMRMACGQPIDYAAAAAYEKKLKHDVVAHVHTFGDACPSARGVIHLGCTSCCVTDNVDLFLMREALKLIEIGIAKVIVRLADFAQRYRSTPTLGYTHYQPAQPTTVGKRACMWIQDFLMDLEEVERLERRLRFRGLKGAVGTQASLLSLFNGDAEKLDQCERRLAAEFGFSDIFTVTGQTYTRKQDTAVIQALASLAASAAKFSNDIRHLAHDREIEEPFGKDQVGSSAMPYKRNPMMDERGVSLARYLMLLPANALHTHAEQWLERTLDDSANRRLVISEAFLTADAILLILQNVTQGLVVFPKIIERRLREELPFLVTEEVIAALVKAGLDRQEAHERIRQHSQAAGARVKQEGLDNNLIDLLRADPFFEPVRLKLDGMLDPGLFIGRAMHQVDEFLHHDVHPVLRPYSDKLTGATELKV